MATFGTVYKAFLMDSSSIAAVKISNHSHKSKTEFGAELSIIACLRCKKLVQLKGGVLRREKYFLSMTFSLMGVLIRCYTRKPSMGIHGNSLTGTIEQSVWRLFRLI